MSDSQDIIERCANLPPEAFDERVQDQILEGLRKGLTHKRAMEAAGVNWPRQWFSSLCHLSERFSCLYTDARRQGIHAMAEGVIDIAEDEPDVMRAKLKADVTRWYVSKMDPRRYGDSLNLNVQEQISVSDALQQARERVINAQPHTQAIENKQDSGGVSTDRQSADSAGEPDDLPIRKVPDGLGDLLGYGLEDLLE